MAAIRVETWVDLIREIYFEPINDELNRHRSQCVYRGMTDARYGLEPGLMRVGEHFADVEMLLFNDFRKYAHRDASPGDSFWNWLAVAQHRGLPTRLLDWTFSPFVALHFATSNLGAGPPGNDAVLWAVNYVETNKLLSDTLALALQENRKNIFSVEMLDKAVSSLHALDTFQDYEFILFMEPPSLDERIVNQAALFSVMSRPEAKVGQPAPTGRLDEFLARKQGELGPGAPDLFKKIVIASNLKWEIRDRLDQANTTERVLFPGMDGLSSWLKRHYTKRGGAVLTSPESKSKDIRLEKLAQDSAAPNGE
jgi:FRG domain